LAARRALIGTGFFSPPDVTPLPNLRTWIEPAWPQLNAHEAQVLDHINAALDRWGQPPLERVAQLYRSLDEDFLLTFPEIDCYPRAAGTKHWGVWSAGMGEPPRWPPGRGAKIFAYLKPFPALPQLLAALNGLPNPCLVYVPGLDPKHREELRNPTLRLAEAPVEMAQVARECDVAILNGTHATAVAMLLAGKPALHIPIFLEQAINAGAAERLGAAISASPGDAKQITAALHRLLTQDQFAAAARSFAVRYANYDPESQIERIVNRADELATNSPA
jgi:hypothetical protein